MLHLVLVVGLEARNISLLEAGGVLRRTGLQHSSYVISLYHVETLAHREYGLVRRHELQDALTEVTEDIGLVHIREQIGVYWVEHLQVGHQRPGQASDEGVDSVVVLAVDYEGDDLILRADVVVIRLMALQE